MKKLWIVSFICLFTLNLVSVKAQAPAAPTANAATVIVQTGFTANWTAVSGTTDYILDVATDAAFTNLVVGYNNLPLGVVTNRVVTGLTSNVTYYYRVWAYNRSGISASSNAITVTTAIIDAPVVTALASNITATGFSANWTASATATGYYLDVATDAAFTSFVAGNNNRTLGNVVTAAVTGLTANTQYYYRVRAFKAAGTSINSNTVSPFTFQTSTTAATNITASSFSANWTAATGATAYFLDVSPDPSFTSFIQDFNNVKLGNVTTFPVPIVGLPTNTTFYYRVRANNAGGTAGNSNATSVVLYPLAPVATKATDVSQTAFTAHWGGVTGATEYYVDVATDASFGNIIPAFNNLNVSSVLAYSFSGLTANTQYYYRVRAYNNITTFGSANSNVIGILTTGSASASAPVAKEATSVAQYEFTANWGIVDGALGYYLDVATDVSFTNFAAGHNNKFVSNSVSYKVLGLTANTTYYYRIRAYNKAAVTDNSNVVSLMTINELPLLPAPVAIAGTSIAAAPHNSFNANWRAVPGATGYYLEIATDAAFMNFVPGYTANLKRVAALTAAVTATPALVANTTYYYRVWSADANGRGACSNVIAYTTPNYTAVPGTVVVTAPTGIDVNSFNANWTAIGNANGATGYFLDVATDAVFTSFVAGFNNRNVGNVVTFAVTGLAVNTQYFYRVRAYNNFGIGANSVSVLLSSPTTSPVTATAATATTLVGFNANWNASLSATGYSIDVATDPVFTYGIDGLVFAATSTFIIPSGGVTTYAVTGLKPNTPYYYRVRATVGGVGTAVNSNVITASTLPITGAPSDPVANAATSINAAGFTANWGAVPANSSYYLDVATDASFVNIIAAYNNLNVGNVVTYAITGLVPSTTYYYRLRSNNSGGISASSNTITVNTAASPAVPSAPVANAATAMSLASFSANWVTVAGTTAYFLDVATDAAFTNFVAGFNNRNVGTVLTFSVTGLVTNTTYYYQVRAYNPGGTSANSNSVTVSTLQVTVPVAPTATAATSAGSPLVSTVTFTANWNALATASGYFIDVALDAAFTTFLPGYYNKDVTTVNAYTITGNGLLPNTIYYYRVRAYNGLGTSGNSNIFSVITPQLVIPATATVAIQVAGTQTGFTASWNTTVNAFGYYLDVATDAAFVNFVPGFFAKNVYNTLNCLVSGLTPNTTYYFRVWAYNASGTAAAASNVITVQTLNINAPIATPATSVTKSAFTANWNAAATATGYYLDVATDRAFAFIVPGYNSIDVTNVLTYPVVGLDASTGYFYRVRAYSASGISPSSNIINTTTNSVGTSVVEVAKQDVRIYASSGAIHIESSDNIQEVYVTNIAGKIVSSGKYSSTSVTVNVNAVSAVYIVKVITNKGVTVKKLSIVL